MDVPFIPTILNLHCEEASFLWTLRQRFLIRSDILLADLAGADERIESHLDGLRVAQERGWKACHEALAKCGSGEVFAAVTCALERGALNNILPLLAVAESDPEIFSGFVSALGWVSPQNLQGVIKSFLNSPSTFHRQVGIAACAMHQVDPGVALAVAITDANPLLRARALRVTGEIGQRDLLAACLTALVDTDAACRFWAAHSAALLGERGKAIDVLKGFVLRPSPFRVRALKLLLKFIEVQQATELLRALAPDPANIRFLIQGAGVVGDPFYVLWLIKQMADLKLTRLAGESFTFITGLDLAYLDLDRKPPETVESGPNDNPDDPDVSMDEDESLPWADPVKIQTWWDANKSRFTDGTRYFMGAPVTHAHCLQVLKDGYQRQRIAAALYLCLLQPGTKLFPTKAPAWRQQCWLADLK